MRLVALVSIALLAAPLLVAAPAEAWLPVCKEYEVSARGTTVHAGECEGVYVYHCPPVGDGPCWALLLA